MNVKSLVRAMARVIPGVAAATTTDDVRRAFYNQVAVGDQYWWWIRAMYVDPNEIIVDDGEEILYRMAYNISGDAVTFGDPQQVQIQYTDVPKKAAAAAAIAGMNTVRGEKVAASFQTRAESRPADNEGGQQVNVDELRQMLGLPAGTPDAEVYAAARQRLSATPEDPATGVGTGGDDPNLPRVDPDDPEQPAPGAPEPAPAPPTPAPEPQQPSTQTGAVLVDRDTLTRLQNQATLGAEAREEQIQAANTSLLDEAIRRGKFPPARRAHYETSLRADREGTIALVNGLADDLVPLTERGAGETVETQLAASDYPLTWLNETERTKVEAARAGKQPASPPVMMDGAYSRGVN